eukprot:3790531-Heterocapsa_arctica.AAC.1
MLSVVLFHPAGLLSGSPGPAGGLCVASCVVLCYSCVLLVGTSGHCVPSILATAAVPGGGGHGRSALAAKWATA